MIAQVRLRPGPAMHLIGAMSRKKKSPPTMSGGSEHQLTDEQMQGL